LIRTGTWLWIFQRAARAGAAQRRLGLGAAQLQSRRRNRTGDGRADSGTCAALAATVQVGAAGCDGDLDHRARSWAHAVRRARIVRKLKVDAQAVVTHQGSAGTIEFSV